MNQLHEAYRPQTWDGVIAQDKVLSKIDALRKRGLSGRAYWLSGGSGQGKTTIARLLAAEIADECAIEELDAGDLNVSRLKEIERRSCTRPLGGKSWAFLVNEAHGLSKAAIRQMLVLFDRIPSHVCWILTSSVEGQERLFEDCDDSSPLLSRCTRLELSRRDLAQPFARRLKEIAEAEGLDGQPVEKYVRLLQLHRNNFRAAMTAVECGEMLP